MFSKNRESFPYTFPQDTPCTKCNFGVKLTTGIAGGTGRNKAGRRMAHLLPSVPQEYTILSLQPHKENKHFLPLSKPTGRAAIGDSTLSAPAVKHTKANYATKQTPETHTLAGNRCVLQRHFNTKAKTSALLHIYKKELQFLSLLTEKAQRKLSLQPHLVLLMKAVQPRH